MAVVSLLLVYFFPAPPSTVTLATAFKGASFDYYGRRYRDRLASDRVNLELRETAGAVENLKLLQDPQSGVDAAFIAGGISNGKRAPGLLSLGIIYNNAFWVFYSSSQPIEHLPQLKGKRIAVGPVGSATRQAAERILGLAGVTESTATFLPFAGVAAAEALKDSKLDAVWILGALEVPAVQALLRNPDARLLSFEMADAYTRIYPDLVRLTLPRGVLDIEKNIPPSDVSLIANVNRVLVRSDLHPEIVYLLSKTMLEEHSEPGIFTHPGEFQKAPTRNIPSTRAQLNFTRMGRRSCSGTSPCGSPPIFSD
jgi:TRAP transporter TAXI family solute receptor